MEANNNNEQEKKKVNEDLVTFLRKRSEHDAPRYTSRLKNYVELQRKKRRAAAARRMSDHCIDKKQSLGGLKRKADTEPRDKTEGGDIPGEDENNANRRGFLGRSRTTEEKPARTRSFSRSSSADEPDDACCPRRRRRRRGCGAGFKAIWAQCSETMRQYDMNGVRCGTRSGSRSRSGINPK